MKIERIVKNMVVLSEEEDALLTKTEDLLTTIRKELWSKNRICMSAPELFEAWCFGDPNEYNVSFDIEIKEEKEELA